MIDGFVLGELLADPVVQLAFVGMQPRLAGDIPLDNIDHEMKVSGGDVEGAHFAAAFD
jgi:hypothetical protein